MSPGGIVFFNRPGEAQRPFLDQIEKVEAFALITLGEIDD